MKAAPNPCAKCGGKKFVGDGRWCQKCQKKKATRARASTRAHGKRVADNFGITPEEYAALLEFQGGVCFICQRPPRSRRLAVDHDHALEVDGRATRESIRGLLCRNCNYVVLGHLKEEPAAYLRAISYLENPPAREVL